MAETTARRKQSGNVVICTYRVKKGAEARFLRLLGRHWPVLRRLGLVTAQRPVTYRGRDEAGGVVVVDIFTWKDAASVDRAHQLPEVMQVWEALGALVEARAGSPPMEFPHYARVAPPAGAARRSGRRAPARRGR